MFVFLVTFFPSSLSNQTLVRILLILHVHSEADQKAIGTLVSKCWKFGGYQIASQAVIFYVLN